MLDPDKKYLITPSLLNSFQYYSNGGSRDGFMDVLHKVNIPVNKAMQIGLDIEKRVELYSKQISEQEDEIIVGMGNVCRDGLWQVKMSRDMVIDDISCLLYGRCDVMKDTDIYEIKYTAKYHAGKYYSSYQHLFYLYCSGALKCTYLITNGRDWYQEEYFNDDDIYGKIHDGIKDFFYYLEGDSEAKRVFMEKWTSKNN